MVNIYKTKVNKSSTRNHIQKSRENKSKYYISSKISLIMITIDGSLTEGGGQILRTSLGLSALTQQPFKIINIRKNRPNPGLREQHLQAVKAIKKLCSAEVQGDELNSKELTFSPGKITKKKLKIKIRTAGSTSLILQTLFLASFNNNLNIRIEGGGTWNLHAPSILYLQKVFLPLLNLNNEIKIIKNGFYPQGGAILEAKITKNKTNFLDLEKREKLNRINCISQASDHLKKSNVARRQISGSVNNLKNIQEDISLKEEYVTSLSPGSGIILAAQYENTILGYDVVGEKGKQSEIVGKEASEGLLKIMNSEATVDNFMIDQILPFLAYNKG